MAVAAIVVAWWERDPTDKGAETEATRLRRDMQAICDACIPRAGVTSRAGEVYWWLREIAHLRDKCSRVRRRYTRCCRWRRGEEETVARVYESYREVRWSLKREIEESKKRALDGLRATLDSDTRGRPYRVVLNKLRPWTAPETEGIDL
jgi:hypothetical protein